MGRNEDFTVRTRLYMTRTEETTVYISIVLLLASLFRADAHTAISSASVAVRLRLRCSPLARRRLQSSRSPPTATSLSQQAASRAWPIVAAAPRILAKPIVGRCAPVPVRRLVATRLHDCTRLAPRHVRRAVRHGRYRVRQRNDRRRRWCGGGGGGGSGRGGCNERAQCRRL